jgi:hypothetical protein
VKSLPVMCRAGEEGQKCPVLWGTPSFLGKSTEAITEIRL